MNVAGLEQFQGEKPEAAQKRSLKKTLRFIAGRHALETMKEFIVLSLGRFGDGFEIFLRQICPSRLFHSMNKCQKLKLIISCNFNCCSDPCPIGTKVLG